MYAKSGGLQGFSGLYTSSPATVAESKGGGVLEKVINKEKIEGGPTNQDDLREAMNVAYKSAIKRSKFIDQIGGQIVEPKKTTSKKAAGSTGKTKSVTKKAKSKKVGSSKKLLRTRW